MATVHVVKQGETLSSIALKFGFRNFRPIFDHPDNAGLKANRDAHVLFPGDQVVIPDFVPKTLDRPTDRTSRFVVQTSGLLLRLKLLDLNGTPLAGTLCDVGLEAGQQPEPVVTGIDGMLEQPFPPGSAQGEVRQGEVLAHLLPLLPPKGTPTEPPEQKIKYDLRIGSLNPETKLSGQQARLNNLGYFAGYNLRDLDQLLWAAEEFACDKIAKGKHVANRPKIEPAPPQGEDDETTSEPNKPTGILDKAIVKKLVAEHGI